MHVSGQPCVVFQIVIALIIDLICFPTLTNTTCPAGRLHLLAYACPSCYVCLACLPVADLDERTFRYPWFESLRAFLSGFMQFHCVCDFTSVFLNRCRSYATGSARPRCCMCCLVSYTWILYNCLLINVFF